MAKIPATKHQISKSNSAINLNNMRDCSAYQDFESLCNKNQNLQKCSTDISWYSIYHDHFPAKSNNKLISNRDHYCNIWDHSFLENNNEFEKVKGKFLKHKTMSKNENRRVRKGAKILNSKIKECPCKCSTKTTYRNQRIKCKNSYYGKRTKKMNDKGHNGRLGQENFSEGRQEDVCGAAINESNNSLSLTAQNTMQLDAQEEQSIDYIEGTQNIEGEHNSKENEDNNVLDITAKKAMQLNAQGDRSSIEYTESVRNMEGEHNSNENNIFDNTIQNTMQLDLQGDQSSIEYTESVRNIRDGHNSNESEKNIFGITAQNTMQLDPLGDQSSIEYTESVRKIEQDHNSNESENNNILGTTAQNAMQLTEEGEQNKVEDPDDIQNIEDEYNSKEDAFNIIASEENVPSKKTTNSYENVIKEYDDTSLNHNFLDDELSKSANGSNKFRKNKISNSKVCRNKRKKSQASTVKSRLDISPYELSRLYQQCLFEMKWFRCCYQKEINCGLEYSYHANCSIPYFPQGLCDSTYF